MSTVRWTLRAISATIVSTGECLLHSTQSVSSGRHSFSQLQVKNVCVLCVCQIKIL